MTTVEVFEYLDELRESGLTKMFGADPYVQAEFGIERVEASRFRRGWMATFSRDKTADERATEFEAQAAGLAVGETMEAQP